MLIGWAWEWPRAKCSTGEAAHFWVRNSFVVTNYEPGVRSEVIWWRCLGCGKRREDNK